MLHSLRPEPLAGPELDVRRPGEVAYGAALAMQREAARQLRAGDGPEVLFLLTHPATITLGRRATETHVLESRAALRSRGVEVVETDRGGDVTYHGPGQVVGYPILDLRRRGTGARGHLRFMEDLLIRVLATYGIDAFRDPDHVGVWTARGKVAALGIRVSGGVSLHGFALNANTAPGAFSAIVPCGIRDRGVASMGALLGREVDLEELMDRIEAAFASSAPRSAAPVSSSSRKIEPVRTRRRLPKWFRRPLGKGPEFTRLTGLVESLDLHTVCQSARCPNRGECWALGTATFMILGEVCTRGCRYCAVPKGKPLALDADEPRRVAEAVRRLDLRHVVITSVDRDDLEDGGAAAWAATIRAVREHAPGCAVEVLIPDFKNADAGALDTVMAERPDILNHNIETVPRLFPVARRGGDYEVSLEVLRRARELAPDVPTKSGMMLGIGERDDEVRRVLGDLLEAGVSLVTLGQYLAPEKSPFYLPVDRFVTPGEFDEWAAYGHALGFRHVEAGPLVRSSYHAEKQANGRRPSES